ncbi:hypothetical protein [Mangrovibacter phragmitis]|uniref:hypothetical protein n=1 Tax=Mangrovibacter phragmitis TaxID=1691903 RepID=UPI00336A642D
MSFIINLFKPSHNATIRRIPFLIISVLYFVLQGAPLMFNMGKFTLIFTVILLLWIYCNAGAMRCRDIGIKGRYFVILWMSIVVIGQIMIRIWGADCDSPGTRFTATMNILTAFFLALTPGKITK